MDVVIPLGRGSSWGDNELRYSLRSLVKFASNIGRVIIVGECPTWAQNVVHVTRGEPTNRNHEHNIFENLLAAAESNIVSENFLAWQDDYFLLDKIDVDTYPYYYDVELAKRVAARHRYDGYAISLDNSRKELEANGFPSMCFDIHCPIRYNKAKFIEYVAAKDWTVGNGFVIKSLYGNRVDASEKKQMKDLKLNLVQNRIVLEHQLRGRHIFSISDKALSETLKKFLYETYPEKSIYEK
jgi:hypothetical protein